MNTFLGELIACGRIDGTGAVPGLASAAGYYQRGCVTTRPGAQQHTGVYTVTLDRGAAPDGCVILVTSESAAVIARGVINAGGLTATITSRTSANPTAAEDAIFEFGIFKVAGGGGATGL